MDQARLKLFYLILFYQFRFVSLIHTFIFTPHMKIIFLIKKRWQLNSIDKKQFPQNNKNTQPWHRQGISQGTLFPSLSLNGADNTFTVKEEDSLIWFISNFQLCDGWSENLTHFLFQLFAKLVWI